MLCMALLFSTGIVNAQNLITVEGNISAKDGRGAVSNISVTVKGSKNGTTTDDKGFFRLNGVPSNGTLIFSSVGFAQQSIEVKGRTQINIAMEASEGPKLDEVVVIGYGTRSKKDVTGAVSQIKATQLENENPSNVADILRGNISGLSISQTNSASAKGGGDLLVPFLVVISITPLAALAPNTAAELASFNTSMVAISLGLISDNWPG